MDKIKTWLNNKLPAGSFIRNVVTLMTGTTFAQALLILIAPILTRLYSPEDFGVFALYTSVLGILAVIACFRYELAIVLPEKDEDAANILALSIIICTSLSLIFFAPVALFKNQLSSLLGAPDLAFWLWFMPLSLLVAGLFQAFNYWSTRRKQFKRLAVRQITQSSVTAVTQISAGATSNIGAAGLIGGHIAGQAVATGRLAGQIWKDEGKQLTSYISKKELKRMLFRYKDFPLYSSWSGILNTASIMMPALLLGYFFTPVVVGFYALGHRVLNTPMSVIGGAVAQVFFPRATEARRIGELDRITFDIFKQLLSIGLVPILLITIVAPELFAIVFGAEWYVAGEYVRWLSLWILFQFISSPISTLYFVLDKQKSLLFFNIVLLSTRMAILVIGGMVGDPLLTIKLLGISGALTYLFLCVYILNMVQISLLKILKYFIKIFIEAIPFVLIPVVTLFINENSLIFVLSAILAGVFFLFIYCIRIRNKETRT